MQCQLRTSCGHLRTPSLLLSPHKARPAAFSPAAGSRGLPQPCPPGGGCSSATFSPAARRGSGSGRSVCLSSPPPRSAGGGQAGGRLQVCLRAAGGAAGPGKRRWPRSQSGQRGERRVERAEETGRLREAAAPRPVHAELWCQSPKWGAERWCRGIEDHPGMLGQGALPRPWLQPRARLRGTGERRVPASAPRAEARGSGRRCDRLRDEE